MPQLANLTVKKYDGVTDVTYVPVSAASSDGVFAEYHNTSGFPIPATRPSFKIATRNNGKGTARRINGVFRWPLFYTDPNGKVVIGGSVPGDFSIVLPQDVDPLIVREAHQQFAKLIASTLMRDTMDQGQAPR